VSRRSRAGFTIVELLTVVIVIGVLAGIAILKYIDLTARARTAQAVGDLQAVQMAAYGYFYETGHWPGEVGEGSVPPELVAYLPKNFTFSRLDYQLDWDNLSPPGGGPSAGIQVGVVVTSDNPRLQAAMASNLGSRLPFLLVGNTLTFIIVGPDGRS
jgi:prepilin-type N-terminal cleavage/methylation domain-containing protein